MANLEPCLQVLCGPMLQVLQGHMQLALADAQSITVLRAIQKGNAPSLVASLAGDTANLYQAAAQAFKQVAATSSIGSKAGRYAEWKLLVFQGYMYAFSGNCYEHFAGQWQAECYIISPPMPSDFVISNFPSTSYCVPTAIS